MSIQSPLDDVRVVEMAGIGPAPFAGAMLAQMGAQVISIDRPGGHARAIPAERDQSDRNKTHITLDLRDPTEHDIARDHIAAADVLIEGFRPGVMEKLGLGPSECFALNPKLVYGRITGWGQTGPWAAKAGHDLNFLATTGLLNAIGTQDGPPVVPLNLMGDYGGGALYLCSGVLAALYSVSRGSPGVVVDAAIVDGVASMMSVVHSAKAAGLWQDRRASNFMDGGSPLYGVYETSDARFVAVTALEPPFFALLTAGLALEASDLDPYNRADWPELRQRLAVEFAKGTRDDWALLFENSDACVTPVLSVEEAVDHPHIQQRGTLSRSGSEITSGPAPRFLPGEHMQSSLQEGQG